MFDVSDVPSFDLSLLFPFFLPLRLLLSLPLRLLLPLPFALALAFARLPFSFHILLSASCCCSLVALSLTYLHHSESCGLCVSVAALIVTWSVSTFCASHCRTGHSHSSKARPLLPVRGHCSNCIARYRPLFTGSHSSRNCLQSSSHSLDRSAS